MKYQDDVLRRYYADRAPEYDDDGQYPQERAPEVAYLRSWVPEVLKGKRVLDVACGTGAWTERIARSAQAVVGVDINEPMLEIARGRRYGVQPRFAIGDAYSLADDLGTFDAAFVGFWLSHVPRSRISEFLASLNRRLSPGATVLMVDNIAGPHRSFSADDMDDEQNTYQMRRTTNGATYRILKNFPSESELVAAITPFGDLPTFRALQYFWTFSYASYSSSVGA